MGIRGGGAQGGGLSVKKKLTILPDVHWNPNDICKSSLILNHTKVTCQEKKKSIIPPDVHENPNDIC